MLERDGSALLVHHSAVVGWSEIPVCWFKVERVAGYAPQERAVAVSYRELGRRPTRRTHVVADNVRYLTVEVAGQVVYDSRWDVPCDMAGWAAAAARRAAALTPESQDTAV
jgi:hypothetical protein